MPNSSAANIARAAASALAEQQSDFGDLPVLVEAALHAGGDSIKGSANSFLSIGDFAAVAALIVAMAQFAWAIWKDTAEKPKAESIIEIERRVTVKFRSTKGFDPRIMHAVIQALEEDKGAV